MLDAFLQLSDNGSAVMLPAVVAKVNYTKDRQQNLPGLHYKLKPCHKLSGSIHNILDKAFLAHDVE